MAIIRRRHNVGDRPEQQVYGFEDSDGVKLDLTGYTASLKWEGTDGKKQTSTASVVTPVDGLVLWTWPAAIFDRVWVVGASVVVTNGTYVFRSDDFVLSIRPGAGDP